MVVVRFRRPFRRGLVLPLIAGVVLGAVVFAFMVGGDPLSLTAQGVSGAQAGEAGSDAPVTSEQGIRVRVIDGDTIEDRDTGERIRLENIDTPETGDRARCAAEREAGAAATRAAREIVAGGTVTVRRTGRTDQYGRTIGFVLVDGRDLGVTLMERGLARPWRGRREAWCAADGSLLPAR